MPRIINRSPHSRIDPVTEILHGVAVTDPYRWLENQDSAETRDWLQRQSAYTRCYLDSMSGRREIQNRIRELLSVETYDSLLIVGDRYIFRKRSVDQEQACIYVRIGPDGKDELLLDPAEFGKSTYTALKPLTVSSDGSLLLYEVKQGGERCGTFGLLDVARHKTLPDSLPRGHLRGFAFAPDAKSFYYVHEDAESRNSQHCCVYWHHLGTSFDDDEEIFKVKDCDNVRLRIIPGKRSLGFMVHRFVDRTYSDFYLWRFAGSPELWLENVEYRIAPLLHVSGRVFGITDRNAPNFRIVELIRQHGQAAIFTDVIAEGDCPIQGWIATQNLIWVAYLRQTQTSISVFDLHGTRFRHLRVDDRDKVRLIAGSLDKDECFFERESFTTPIRTYRYSLRHSEPMLWAKRALPFDPGGFSHKQVWFTAKDGIKVPMSLVGRREVLEEELRPTIMTAYGGYGVPMTPQFSVFVTFLMERGCLVAVPNIRGGSEFGAEWHVAAKRRRRQVAFDDFLAAVEWLVDSGRSDPGRVAIFGGSNAGLLMGAAMTQRPDLFRAVVCMVPILDMLRYHLFDHAHVWKDEFGTSEDPEDFAALASYSPYHCVSDGKAYPATMIISGDADQTCNPLHARKMTARLQAANASSHPILLDYRSFRGHSPVLPLSERIAGLSDRLAFLCDQLDL